MRRSEIKKFKSPIRRQIFESIELSSTQKKEIDNLYTTNYKKKIPYVWHQHYTAFTQKFDVNYFPELLFIPEFEHFMNLNSSYCDVFQDKNMLPILASSVGVRMPKSIASCSYGIYKDCDGNVCSLDKILSILSNSGDLFAKPSIDSCSGQGCRLLNFENSLDVFSGDSINKILDELGENFVIQEKIKCHESISKIYPDSVNTFRVITYRWNSDILVMPSIMRIGQGGNFLDNAHAGGMFIAIDSDGRLHDTAFTEFKLEFKYHPDTKVVFKDYLIPNFPQVLLAAKRMHNSLPALGCINWDFTLDESNTPILIEANINGGSIWMSQMSHGKGVFGDLTPMVLKWIRLMKGLNCSEQKKHLFGKF